MTLYMIQTSVPSETWAQMIRNPQDRAEQVRPLIEAAGGTLHGYYYSFGDHDTILIVELPDNVTTAAIAIAVAGSGALSSVKTTVLLSPEEGVEALRRAKGVSYNPPG